MNKQKFFTPILLVTAFWASASYAAVLDFEGYANGQIIDSEYNPTVTISTVNFSEPNLAVIFDSRLSGTRDGDLEAPFNSNNPALADGFTPGNILVIQENNIGCADGICDEPDDEGPAIGSPAGIISFVFAEAITLNSIDFFDVETDTETVNNAINLFDSNGDELNAGIFFTPDTGGDNLWDQVVFGVEDVSRIDVHFGGSGALDNLVYIPQNPSEIPLPPAILLFGAALFGLTGLRRKI